MGRIRATISSDLLGYKFARWSSSEFNEKRLDEELSECRRTILKILL